MEKKGLGRGLSSLLGVLDEKDDEIVSLSPQERKEEFKKLGVEEIEIGLIDNNPKQPRKNFSPTALNELAESIKQHGIIQPIILVQKGKRYMIVAGERRFRASKIAGLKKLPAVVKDYTEDQIKEIALLENIQREDLNPIETARALNELLTSFEWTQEVLADRLGKSRPAIANYLRLLTLSPAVIALVEDGKLSAGHARTLVMVKNPDAQLKLANLAIVKRITVREMEKAVKELDKPEKKQKVERRMSTELSSFQDSLQRTFGTMVNIKGNDKKGKIIIDYYNSDDLDRIYSILNKNNNKF